MHIDTLSWHRIDMDLSEPYTIAYETVSSTSNVVLQLTTDTGLHGWGCAAPDQMVTGETSAQVLQALEQVVAPLLHHQDPFRIALLVEQLRAALPGQASTLAMVDMALFDLLARKADLPLYQLLGGYRQRIATSITIGIKPLDQTLTQAKDFLSQGFRSIKLKGGLCLEEDVEKVRKLRECCGYDFSLRFDANQGYTSQQAISFIEQLTKEQLEIIEQPTCKAREETMGEVTHQVPVPVMADESVATLRDAFHLAANGLTDMINIKLQKMGGLFQSLHINSVAKAAGMEVMVGCLDECSLGIAAGLHCALSRANIEYADLDGHLDLHNDPFRGLVRLQDGFLYPSDQAGLGQITASF